MIRLFTTSRIAGCYFILMYSFLLSGGLDSGVITALCAKENPVDTYSFDFTDNDVYFKGNTFQPELDRPYVIKTSEYLNTNHEFLYCGYEELADSLYDAVLAKDIPGMADIDSSLLYFCKKVAVKHKVALTGECSDEIFGGYPWFRNEEAFKTNAFPWSRDLEFRKRLFSKDLKIDLDGYVNMRYTDSVYNSPRLSGEDAKESRRREISYLTMRHFMTTLIDRLDRASAHASLICRTPFSDHRLVEYLWNVPWSYKCKNGIVKGLLRDAAKGLLPEELIMRKKSPYPKTYNPFYERLLAERLEAVLNDKTSPVLQLIDVEAVREFIKSPSDYGSPWFGQLMAAPQMLAYLLQINYWLKAYNIEILMH